MRQAMMLILGMLLPALPGAAQRQPVLPQIKVPHSYYFREMYLPQITAGPASPAWSPDGTSLVYAMAGSLWRQRIDGTRAEQLTDGPGDDHQPDWAPDGRSIVFTRHDGQAMELMRLDLESGAVTALTSGGDVNIEPRLSPDGRRIAFVSTRGTGRFHIFTATLGGEGLADVRLFAAERRSDVVRYYYDAIDHEISPAWSPDGRELAYVGNPEIAHGSGAIWRRAVEGGAPVLVRREETNWKARPEWTRDGKRIVYASYLGRQWHQLWIVPTENGDYPIPLTYGDFDATSPRVSPDGRRIAYISNESGNTEIRIRELVGGGERRLEIGERVWRRPTGRIVIETVDGDGRPVPVRLAVRDARGRPVMPDDSWLHADDGFDPARSVREVRYFHSAGRVETTAPAGRIALTAWHGPEHHVVRDTALVKAGETLSLRLVIRPLDLPRSWEGMESGDLHVHMNYGGTWRATPERLVEMAKAEDLDRVFNLIVNKEQRIPDIGYFSPMPDAASTPAVTLHHAQEFHSSFWGHLGLLGLGDHLLLPDYAGYPHTAAASLYPDNATVADLAHEQGALVGYVHPFDAEPDPLRDAALSNALPVDVALGKVDYMEIVGFSDHRATAAVWYRLLDCGFRLPAGAGTDAMTNFASLRGPVGLNRVYVRPGDDGWLGGLRAGRSMATNGPLLALEVAGQEPGATIVLPSGRHSLPVGGFMRSAIAIDHLELVVNGTVARRYDLADARDRADIDDRITLEESAWILLRASNDAADPDLFDIYPYATTSPVYVRVGEDRQTSPEAAAYFLAWIDRIAGSVGQGPYNDETERAAILGHIAAARRAIEKQCR